ncbi:MAG: hypothetical protein LOY00_05035, partial [Methylocaldum sp.]|nr:hypothetical protein [Methylocaldum sp.]
RLARVHPHQDLVIAAHVVGEIRAALGEDRLVLKRAVMPSMLTLDKRIIRQDCFCYLMERKSLNL